MCQKCANGVKRCANSKSKKDEIRRVLGTRVSIVPIVTAELAKSLRLHQQDSVETKVGRFPMKRRKLGDVRAFRWGETHLNTALNLRLSLVN